MADGSPNFGILPMGVPDVTDEPAPIRLQRGNAASFGAAHIDHKHGHWVGRHSTSVPELVWRKCRQSGVIYIDDELDKGKIWMPIQPAAFMVLRYNFKDQFWSVTTLYLRGSQIDGDQIGRYLDTMTNPPATPVFSIRTLPLPPVITVKRKRTFTIPS